MTRKIGQYCLVCFETLKRGRGECASCGHPVRPFERRKYWSLHPSHVRLQKLLILLSFLLTLAIEYVFITELRGYGRGVGYALAMPWIGFAFLVFIIRHLTRHMAVANAKVVLGILPFLAAVLFLNGEMVWGVVALFASTIPILIRMSFRAWKSAWVTGAAIDGRLVDSGQDRLAHKS